MSFRLKTILGISVIEITLLAILVLNGIAYLRQSSEAEMLQRGTVTAQLFATMTSDAVLSVDLATLDSLVDQTLNNSGIEYVRVRSENGMVLSEGGNQVALDAPFVEDASIEATANDRRLDVSAPIFAAGTSFGRVEIGLSTDRLQMVIAEARQWMLTIAGFEIIFVALFGVVLGTVLTRQLARLREAASRVSTGEFGHQITVQGNDELADTTRSFNTMSSALADFAREAAEARDRAEAGRAYAETVLHDALNSMPQSMLIINADDQVAFANDSYRARHQAAAALLDQETPAAQTVFDKSLAEFIEEAGERIEFSVQDRMARLSEAEAHPQWQATMPDGSVIMTTQERMSDGGVVVVEHDVTELFAALERNRVLESELMETQKMESLGTMAGGIAHEINTPVQFVGDNLKFLEEAFGDVREGIGNLLSKGGPAADAAKQEMDDIDWAFIEEEIPGAFSEARTGIGTVGDIVKSIKDFAHPDSDAKVAQDLEKIIQNTITVSGNQWRLHADVSCVVAPGLEEVPCFAGKLSQVLINLIVNAADALEEHQPGQKGEIDIRATQQDGFAVITVSDNGPGIPADKVDQVFDMFFTTKPPGKGTGQGLAICKRIIENNHGGALSVTSSEGQGATFTVKLPLNLEQVAA